MVFLLQEDPDTPDDSESSFVDVVTGDGDVSKMLLPKLVPRLLLVETTITRSLSFFLFLLLDLLLVRRLSVL